MQVIGGFALHQGNIAEMKTGEGKTLVATMPTYLNALSGKGVHVVTVNDYLARRDAEWMGQLYRWLGPKYWNPSLMASMIKSVSAYASDITYGPNNEFLVLTIHDNMKFKLEDYVQKAALLSLMRLTLSSLMVAILSYVSGPARSANIDLYLSID